MRTMTRVRTPPQFATPPMSWRIHTPQLGHFLSECPQIIRHSRGFLHAHAWIGLVMRGADLAHFPHHPLSDLIWRTIEVQGFFFPLRWHVAHQLRPLTLHLLVRWIPRVILRLLLRGPQRSSSEVLRAHRTSVRSLILGEWCFARSPWQDARRRSCPPRSRAPPTRRAGR